MLSALITSVRSYPTMLLAEQLVHQWYVHPGPLVLGTNLFNFPTPTEDRDRTVSRRSEPSSRTALNGEQPYPWDLLQPQDAMSRHRGAKPPRRCELLGEISLLSPAYLFILWAMALPHRTTGSLWPTFVSARSVSSTVRVAYAIILNKRFSIRLKQPFASLLYF